MTRPEDAEALARWYREGTDRTPQEERDALRAENERLREALRWYAERDDVNNYVAVAALEPLPGRNE